MAWHQLIVFCCTFSRYSCTYISRRYQGNNLWQCMPWALWDQRVTPQHAWITVTTQVWSGDHQQSERRAFTQAKTWRLRDIGLLPIIEIFSFKKIDLKCSVQNDNLNKKNTRQPNLFTNTLCLTHWSRDKLDAFEMHFVERNYHVGSESGSATKRRQAIIGSKNRLINRLNRVFMHP